MVDFAYSLPSTFEPDPDKILSDVPIFLCAVEPSDEGNGFVTVLEDPCGVVVLCVIIADNSGEDNAAAAVSNCNAGENVVEDVVALAGKEDR